MRYDDPTQSLTRSDVEILENRPEPQSIPGSLIFQFNFYKLESNITELLICLSSDGKFKAVVLDFSLKSSCYATMLLRELQKQATEKRVHAAMFKQHLDDSASTSESAALPATEAASSVPSSAMSSEASTSTVSQSSVTADVVMAPVTVATESSVTTVVASSTSSVQSTLNQIL